MLNLRHAVNFFLLLTVLALAVPVPLSQDNTKPDDSPGQSDRSDDQQNDPIVLSDFIFEDQSIFRQQLPREICSEIISTAPESFPAPEVSGEFSFLPHIFVFGSGLMPRAPALA